MYCSSCGHPLCPSCTCEASENTVEARRAPAAAGTSSQPEKHDDISAAGDRLEKPRRRVPTQKSRAGPDSKDAEPSVRSDVAGPDGNAPEKKPPEQRPVVRRGTLTANPFLVADRTTRRSLEDLATPSEAAVETKRNSLSECLPSRKDYGADVQGDCGNARCRATHAGHSPFRHAIDCPVYGRAGESRQDDEAASRQRARPKTEQQAVQDGSSDGPRRDSSAPSGGPRLEQRQEATAGQAAQAPTARQDESTRPAGQGHDEQQPARSLPRARVASPPTWLKTPSTKPASIEGRLHRVEARSRARPARVSDEDDPVPDLSERRASLRNTPPQPREATRAQFPPVQLKKTQPKPADSAYARGAAEDLSETDDGRRLQAIPETREPLPAQSQSRKNSSPQTTSEGDERLRRASTTAQAPESHSDDRLGAAASSPSEDDDSADLHPIEIHHPWPIMPPNHDCDWKEKYMALTAEVRQLKAEVTGRADDEATDEAGEKKRDEFGIEGLTIVMHMKGQDDLVINTDLRDTDDS